MGTLQKENSCMIALLCMFFLVSWQVSAITGYFRIVKIIFSEFVDLVL